MKAVILAAGKSTRTFPLTLTKPKPLLKVANKTIIEYTLENLKGIVDEVIIVIGYKGDLIRNKLGGNFQGIKIKYVEQSEQLGSGHALQLVKDQLEGKFIVINGDDLHSRKDLLRCLNHDYCVLAQKVDNPSRFGVLGVVNNHIITIIEKPQSFVSDLANTGIYILDKDIFNIEIKKSERGELEIIDYIHSLIQTSKVNYEVVEGHWCPIAFPWDLLEANRSKLENLKGDAKVLHGVTVEGNLVIGEGTKLLPGVYIEGNVVIGKDCKIGPNCYIRGDTSIGDNCRIGNAVEIKNCIIGDNSTIGHLSYFGDSIVGDNVNVGAGSITANLRHDDTNVRSYVNGDLIDTKLRKVGAIIGDKCHLGINTSIYPGRKLWPGATTLPGEIVKEDKQC